MAITFPLTLPSNFRSIRFRPVSITGRTASTFTGQRQYNQWNGEWWEAEIEYPPLERANAESVITVLTACRGGAGSFLLSVDKNSRTPRGTASSVTVNGGGQTGTAIALTGTGTLLAGDYIQIGTGSTARLYKVLQNATLPATAEIFPRLRESPSNGASVVLASPVGLFTVADNQPEWNIDVVRLFGCTVKAIEYI